MCSCICILHKHWKHSPLRSKNKTGVCLSMFGADSPSAGAPGIPLPGAGTITAFLSSVRHTHWSNSALSRSESASVLSAKFDQQWSTNFAYRGISSSNILNIIIYIHVYICILSFSAYRISREKHDLWHRNPFTIKQAFIDELPGIFYFFIKGTGIHYRYIL